MRENQSEANSNKLLSTMMRGWSIIKSNVFSGQVPPKHGQGHGWGRVKSIGHSLIVNACERGGN